jgi:hypothetical protein
VTDKKADSEDKLTIKSKVEIKISMIVDDGKCTADLIRRRCAALRLTIYWNPATLPRSITNAINLEDQR